MVRSKYLNKVERVEFPVSINVPDNVIKKVAGAYLIADGIASIVFGGEEEKKLLKTLLRVFRIFIGYWLIRR